MELKNKVVVITGGTKGLGRAMALSFQEEGARVVVCARDEEGFNDLPEGILAFKADVTKEEELNKLLKYTIEEFGNVDIWVNNAGIWLPHLPVEEVDWVRAHNLMEVNLFGTAYGSKVALTQMRKQGSGIIMNIISTSALEGKINETAYCASKFAAMGFTKSLQKEVDGSGIVVIAVYPGRMKTDLFNECLPENYNECMDPSIVSNKIIENLKKEKIEEELIIQK